MDKQNILKRNIADNLIFYRKQKGLTQLDIAEKFNYSDKAVSKWERAEAVPDVYTLKQISELIKALESIIVENVEIFALSDKQKDEMFNKVLEHVINKSKLIKTLSKDTIEYVYVVEPIKNLLRN
jgi:transcriptional regulator with XRE-family HTH domain